MASLKKNIASQKWKVYAYDTSNNGAPVTGDAANITAKIAKDWAAAAGTNDTNPTEVEDGYYLFDLTQAETNADQLDLYPESSTANVLVVGSPATQTTIPAYFPDLGIESDGDLTKVNTLDGHTAQTADHTAGLAKVPKSDGTVTWNATALASINAEADTALADYDGPTNAEMVARTLLAASYFDPAADTVANVTTVGSISGVTFPTNFADLSITVTTGRVDVAAVGGTSQTANDNGADINTLLTDLASVPNNTELAAAFTEIKGATWSTGSDTLEHIRDKQTLIGVDAAAVLVDTDEMQQDLANGGRLDLLIDAILADTGELQTDLVNGGRLDLLIDAILADTNEVQGDLADAGRVDALIDGIKAVTDALTAAAATKLAASSGQIIVGAVDAGTLSTTEMTTDLAETTDSHYDDCLIIFTTGVLAGQRSEVTTYTGAGGTGLILHPATTEAPSAGDGFVLL